MPPLQLISASPMVDHPLNLGDLTRTCYQNLNLSTQIQLFFEINDMPDIGSDTLWESFKAYLRGQIISFVSHYKKSERSKLTEISDEIRELDGQYSANPSATPYKKRLQLQSQYYLLSTGKVERQLLQTKQRFFEQGDKAGKLLA